MLLPFPKTNIYLKGSGTLFIFIFCHIIEHVIESFLNFEFKLRKRMLSISLTICNLVLLGTIFKNERIDFHLQPVGSYFMFHGEFPPVLNILQYTSS